MRLRRASEPATENGDEGGAIKDGSAGETGGSCPLGRRTEERCFVPRSARGSGVALITLPLRMALLEPPCEGVIEECAGVTYAREEGG